MTTNYELDLVHDNPFNERPLDLAHVDRIALSVKADSMLHPPMGRPHPTQPGAVELAFGHHRLAAYRKLRDAYGQGGDLDTAGAVPAASPNPWCVIPIDTRDIDDRRMARYAIVENHHRSDPSAIEKARALLRMTTDPKIKISQAAAGELFELGQSSVAHLLSLLQLPDSVQALVDSRQLPETPARALARITAWRPDLVEKIAAAAVKEENPAASVATGIAEALRRNAPLVDNERSRPWPVTWPAKPAPVPENSKAYHTLPGDIRACKGCPFNLERDEIHYCLRRECYDSKHILWSEHEVERVATQLGIQPDAPDDKTAIIWQGDYDNALRARVQKLIAAKLPELRISARPRSNGGYTGDGYGLQDVFGSKAVVLGTVNQSAVSAWLTANAGARAVAPPKTADETPAQQARRIVAEKELAEERGLERQAFNRAKADVLWLVEHVAELIAERTVAAGGLLAFADRHFANSHTYNLTADWPEMVATKHALAQRSGSTLLESIAGDNSTPETDLARRKHLVYTVLAHNLTGYDKPSAVYDFGRGLKISLEMAKEFRVEMPAGWDLPIIHESAINCWECGVFSTAAGGHLTQSDTKAGWRSIYLSDKGAEVAADYKSAMLAGVGCPRHAEQVLLVARKRRTDMMMYAPPGAHKGDVGLLSKTRMTKADAGPLPPSVSVAIPEVTTSVKPDRRTAKGRAAANAQAAAHAADRIRSLAPKASKSTAANRIAAEQAAARARSLAKANVHGHTRPAPKPSAKKTTRRKVARKER